MITEYDFKKTDSPDAKQTIAFLDGMHFDIHAKGKSFRDKNYYNKRAILASGLKTIFLPDELCNRLGSLLQKKAGNNFDMINQEKVAITDKLLEYKSINSTQHKKIKNFNLI